MASNDLIRDIDRATQIIEQNQITSKEERAKLLASAQRLVSSLESTEDEAWRIMMGPTTQAALLAVIRLGVFEIFVEQTMSATEIAAKTGADYLLVVRLMRALLVNNIFEEVGIEKYAQNALSKLFGDKVFQPFLFGIAFIDSRMPKLADFLESINFQNPLQPNNGLLQYANNTKLSTMEWLKANPKELELISNTQVAQTLNWRSSNRSALSSLFPPDYHSDVLVVDVGGGRGEALEDLRAHRPDLEGRMIFQDLPEVFAGREHIPGVTAMAHDFFEPQPVKGASVYLFRHVLHDWPDETNQKILLNIIPALAPQSRIVIQEQVVPIQGASLLNVGIDISMMLFSGMERSEKQWGALFDSAGLQIVKITPPKPHKHEIAFDSMIEAVRKT